MTESGGGVPEIDLIIAVHSAERPIERAVRSVLEGTPRPAAGGPSLRVSVVCHDLPSSAVAARTVEQEAFDIRDATGATNRAAGRQLWQEQGDYRHGHRQGRAPRRGLPDLVHKWRTIRPENRREHGCFATVGEFLAAPR